MLSKGWRHVRSIVPGFPLFLMFCTGAFSSEEKVLLHAYLLYIHLMVFVHRIEGRVCGFK